LYKKKEILLNILSKQIDIDGGALFFRSGDIATIDDKGYCRISGRIKDVIIRAGENISPKEVEDLLYHHPQVRDVSVVAVPDPKYGEEICAWIVTRDGREVSSLQFKGYQILVYKNQILAKIACIFMKCLLTMRITKKRKSEHAPSDVVRD
jgi:acyl-CoA synthetase (AMP-forming)/AMP-acid ligase II